MDFSSSAPQQDILTTLWSMLVWLYDSPLVFVLKLLIGVYIFILLADLVMLLILRDVPSNVRTSMRGMDIPVISKKKMLKQWAEIKSRLSSGDASQYKIAIIEADSLVDKILGGIGYSGRSMGEKFDQIEPAHLDSHRETLKEAHNIRNRIVNEEEFSLDQKSAENVIQVYEDFLKYLEYLD